jgi:Tol biopolymer transport system component
MLSRTSLALSIMLFSPALTIAQTTRCLSLDPASGPANGNSGSASISGDGRYVVFTSTASNLVSGDTNGRNDVFVRDRHTGITERVSLDSNGIEGNDNSSGGPVSADGRYVAFQSPATNLVPGDTNGSFDVFIRDRQTGQTTRASVDSFGAQANGHSFAPSMSADGRYVAFQSFATNLVPFDTNGQADIFVHDLSTGATRRVSVDSAGAQSNGGSTFLAISGNGRFVSFSSLATNLVANDTNGFPDIFVHDLLTAATERVSVDSSGGEPNQGSAFTALSFDGRFVAFDSGATNLVANDTNGQGDIFVHDRATGTTERVDVSSNGQQANQGEEADGVSISADGRFVAFASRSTNLALNDLNNTTDVFLHDRLTGETTMEDVNTSGVQSNQGSTQIVLSADARFVAFSSFGTNLVPNDPTNGDVFLRDHGASASFDAFCFGDGSGGSCPCSNNGSLHHGCANSAVGGGAILSATGVASLSNDTVVLASSSEPATALSVVLQGSEAAAPRAFGGGLRCASGVLLRPYTKNANGGSMSAPQGSEPSISLRSAILGDPIALGSTRIYQVYYRDSNLAFCPAGFNVSNAIATAWGS